MLVHVNFCRSIEEEFEVVESVCQGHVMVSFLGSPAQTLATRRGEPGIFFSCEHDVIGKVSQQKCNIVQPIIDSMLAV